MRPSGQRVDHTPEETKEQCTRKTPARSASREYAGRAKGSGRSPIQQSLISKLYARHAEAKVSSTGGKTTRMQMSDFCYWYEQRDDLITKGLREGMSANEIATWMGLAHSTVLRYMRRHGLEYLIRNTDTLGNPTNYRPDTKKVA